MISQHDIDAFDEMRTHYIFDVDGTLTPSRGLIDPEFSSFFYDFCCRHNVYLVTGSDKPKTVEQLGNVIFDSAQRVYNCSGNDVYEKEQNVYTSDWTLPEDARNWLNTELDKSKFVLRTGNHIEERTGMVNFSIVGRNATLGERKLYVEWDENTLERLQISAQFNFRFPDLKSTVGGDTGIDIYAKGKDKSQIMRDFGPNDRIVFFGDAMQPNGNDYPLANAITNGESIHVKDWHHTYKTLLGMVS